MLLVLPLDQLPVEQDNPFNLVTYVLNRIWYSGGLVKFMRPFLNDGSFWLRLL